MELSEDELFESYVKKCKHCSRSTILPNHFEYTCFACG